MKTKMISRLGYSEFYIKSESINELIKNINLDTALEFLVLLNKYEHLLYEKEIQEIKFILNEWIPKCTQEFKNEIIQKFIKHSERITLKDVKIINKITCIV